MCGSKIKKKYFQYHHIGNIKIIMFRTGNMCFLKKVNSANHHHLSITLLFDLLKNKKFQYMFFTLIDILVIVETILYDSIYNTACLTVIECLTNVFLLLSLQIQ